ncbi:DUF1186 domain-containing protein [Caenispirillum bisanense]|uniref:SEC-C motif-containing protein n=1 Tax=Caenispirillum bisanense TaxID=414052 RepID=A0A286H156_9PROT|nr:DUF1186 domain-containing protein [Caenispirillum bisanense]SOE01518.1 SEC-C motif-containing protein [Caenispirillum bisanense]
MQADDIILAFTDAGHDLPADAMRAAVADWDAVAPELLRTLEAYADGSHRSAEAENALFFIIHLMGQVGETRAFKPLCRLCMDAEAPENILGDGVTESLKRILISTWDGDAEALKAVIENPDGDEYVRFGALEAMGYLTALGEIDREAMKGYINHLLNTMEPRDGNFAWVGLGWVPAQLGFANMEWVVEDLVKRRLVDESEVNQNLFRMFVDLSRSTSDGLAAFHYDGVRPMGDAVEHLAAWHAFSEEAKRAAARPAVERASTLPNVGTHTNPDRHVGRNDPCPCGSGKKFKKCCLH